MTEQIQAGSRISLGQRVRVRAFAKKYRLHPHQKRERGEPNRLWKRREFPSPVEGIYIGYRTTYNGVRAWESYGDDSGFFYFMPTSHQEMWLVVISDRQNPVYVFPDDVEILW
jgi:hypothetical protein